MFIVSCLVGITQGMCVFRYLQADPEHFDLRELKSQFDVILLEPPLEEYYRESGISHTERFWTWDDVCLAVFFFFLHGSFWTDSTQVHI